MTLLIYDQLVVILLAEHTMLSPQQDILPLFLMHLRWHCLKGWCCRCRCFLTQIFYSYYTNNLDTPPALIQDQRILYKVTVILFDNSMAWLTYDYELSPCWWSILLTTTWHVWYTDEHVVTLLSEHTILLPGRHPNINFHVCVLHLKNSHHSIIIAKSFKPSLQQLAFGLYHGRFVSWRLQEQELLRQQQRQCQRLMRMRKGRSQQQENGQLNNATMVSLSPSKLILSLPLSASSASAPPSLMTMSYQGEVASPPGLSKLNNATKASLFSVSTSTMPTLFATMAPLFSISTSMLLPRAEVLLLLQVMRLLIRFISFIKSATLPLTYIFCYHKIWFYQVQVS